MAAWITPEDLAPFADIEPAKAQAMIDDARAMALMAAPCLADLTDETRLAQLKAILRRALLRWAEAGSGLLEQRSVSIDDATVSDSYGKSTGRALFWPSELDQLRDLCGGDSAPRGKAYMVDMTGIVRTGNPLAGAVVNAYPGVEPMGAWSDDRPVL